MRYKESKRAKEYQIDVEGENILLQVNDALKPLEEKLKRSSSKIDVPLVFFCYAPRSGSTVISQFLARSGRFNYVSNFMARFWKVPYLGGIMEKEVGTRDQQVEGEYTSVFGRTKLPSDPHEFGFFWNMWLRPQDTTVLKEEEVEAVDTDGLRSQVAAIASLYQKPLFFKSGIAGMNAGLLHKIFPEAHFITIKREYAFIAQSLLKTRERFLGNIQEWWSIKPSAYPLLKDLHYIEQVAGQVVEIYRDIEHQLSAVPSRKKCVIQYEDFCLDPNTYLRKIMEFIGENADALSGFNHSSIEMNNKITIEASDFQAIEEAIKKNGAKNNVTPKVYGILEK